MESIAIFLAILAIMVSAGFKIDKLLLALKEEIGQLKHRVSELGTELSAQAKLDAPALVRLTEVGIEITPEFWSGAVRLTEVERDRIKPICWGDRSESAPSGFAHATILISIQEWRGGYFRISLNNQAVAASSGKGRREFELYPGSWPYELTLWELELSDDELVPPRLMLKIDRRSAHFFAVFGRFGSAQSFVGIDPAEDNSFLRIPLREEDLRPYLRPEFQIETEAGFRKPDRHLSCYEASINERGLVWRVIVRDFDQLATIAL